MAFVLLALFAGVTVVVAAVALWLVVSGRPVGPLLAVAALLGNMTGIPLGFVIRHIFWRSKE